MANRWGNSANSVRLYFFGLQNHCQINDDVHVGVTTENFREFFKKNILDVIESERK